MTITTDEIQAVAPDVPAKAQERRGITNPFISLQSLEALCQGNETLEFCLKEVVIISLRYAETVCRFEQIIRRGQQSNEDDTRKEIETLRTAVHDSTIDSINVLARNLRKAGKDNGWVKQLIAGQRPAYAKFAILIAFEVVLQERKP
jgi:hypothetical protein